MDHHSFVYILLCLKISVTTLAKAQVAILGKCLRRSKGIMQLVKCKDTGMYLRYLCKSIVQQQDIHED